jgi:hypothetical protein
MRTADSERCPCRAGGEDLCGSVERNLNRAVCSCVAEYQGKEHAAAYPSCFNGWHDAKEPPRGDETT